MVDYKMVKYCRSCKARFVVERSERRAIYCNPCEKRIQKSSE